MGKTFFQYINYLLTLYIHRERSQLQHEIKYDWTYSTTYKGTLRIPKGNEQTNFDTDDRLNLEKLKEREKILFYEELSLYEDELHDNGTSNLSVKIVSLTTHYTLYTLMNSIV